MRRISRLPNSVKQIPPKKRVDTLQSIVNHELHRRNICPVARYVAGPIAYRVEVIRRNRAYHVESNFPRYDRATGETVPETLLETLAIEAINKAE